MSLRMTRFQGQTAGRSRAGNQVAARPTPAAGAPSAGLAQDSIVERTIFTARVPDPEREGTDADQSLNKVANEAA